jgi:hypothetical protein
VKDCSMKIGVVRVNRGRLLDDTLSNLTLIKDKLTKAA